jgi:hypothetical protein
MLEKIKDLLDGYWDQIMTWYGGQSELAQYGVLFAVFVGAGLLVALYLLSRITRK